MIIQAISYGGVKEEPFAFTYSGDFTDNRVDGVGTVRLNTSGTLTVLSGKATVLAYILAGGGGAGTGYQSGASGGGGGNQTVEVTLEPGTYDIVIGTGGAKGSATTTMGTGTGSDGGDTTAFGYTSTGGGGGSASRSSGTGGEGGTPNGGAGAYGMGSGVNPVNKTGGTPNGGAVVSGTGYDGGDGYVDLTFS